MREVIVQMLATEEEARRIVSDASKEADALMATSRAKAVEVEEKVRRELQEESAKLVAQAEREAKAVHDAVVAKAAAEAKKMSASEEQINQAVKLAMREVLGEEA